MADPLQPPMESANGYRQQAQNGVANIGNTLVW